MSSKPLSVLVVDDEPLARDRLVRLCSGLEGVEVAGQAASGGEALEKAAELVADVLLLDISMPGLDGLQTALALKHFTPVPAVVFVTAHDHFAVSAFDVSVVDYLLKPVERERLSRALDRCRSLGTSPLDLRPKSAFATEFWAMRRGSLVRVRTDDLTHIEAERDYVRLNMTGDSFLIKTTFSSLVAELDPAAFLRTHRSFAVARSAIAALAAGNRGDHVLILNGGIKVPIGRSYHQSVKKQLVK